MFVKKTLAIIINLDETKLKGIFSCQAVVLSVVFRVTCILLSSSVSGFLPAFFAPPFLHIFSHPGP